MNLTDEQRDIRETGSSAVRAGRNLVVIAFAGAGKTTTLTTLAEAIPTRGCYLAFNKSIAEEAKRKLAKTRCTAATMHGLAFGTVRDIIDSPTSMTPKDFRSSGIRGRFHVPTVKGWHDFRLAAAVCRTVAAYCNSADAEITTEHAVDAIIQATGDPELLRSDKMVEQAEMAIDRLAGPLAEMATAYWSRSIENGNLSHDIYLKLLDLDEGLRGDAFRGFRYLMVDEAQDINPVQRSILMKSGLPLIAVGDPYQQIYSWRGAENALAQIDGEIRYLTQSFRFGEDIAATARMILASRPDGGPEQRLSGVGGRLRADHKGPRAAIICRTNLGMIDEAIRAVSAGRQVHIDNVDKLIADVRSAEALHQGDMSGVVSPDIRQFDSWEELVAEAEDSGGGLARLVQIVEKGMVEHVERLRTAHADVDAAEVIVCTAHRSKGLEFPAVVIGRDWKDIDTMRWRHVSATRESAKATTLAMEEWNALYVAATRPILRLSGLRAIFGPEMEGEPLPKRQLPAASDAEPTPTR